MSPNNNLSPGFITVDDACSLIKSDTRENPVVDMDYLVAHIVWIETSHNFRIPKIRRLAQNEIYRTKRGRVVEYEHIGDAYVYIATNFEKELIKKTILDKFGQLVDFGRNFGNNCCLGTTGNGILNQSPRKGQSLVVVRLSPLTVTA